MMCRVGNVGCSPPGSVVMCGNGLISCTVTNGYGAFPDRSTCKAAQVVFPSTEEEVLSSVAGGVVKKQKMRVVTRYSHSIPKLICPGGDSGLLIGTRDLDHVVSVDNSAMRMSFEGGVPLRKLVDEAAKEGLALPHCPYWEGVTIGGILSTGAHGSSLFGKGSAVHEYVVGMRLVVPASEKEGYAKVIVLKEDDEDLNAAKVSLGVLGVISQVTLQLQPMFKRSVTNLEKDDIDLENMVIPFGLVHEFGDISWYPSQGKAVYRVDDRVPVHVAGEGLNDFIGFQASLTPLLSTIRTTEELEEETSDAEGLCLTSKLQVSVILGIGTGLQNNDKHFTGYPVIGFQHKMQSSGSCLVSPENELLTACPWDPRIKGQFFHQIGVSIGLSKIRDFLLDLKKLRDMDPKSLCVLELYDGILIRYVKASNAYLGKQEDSADMDITFYRSHNPKIPPVYIDVLQEIEQMAFFKYGGVPHWGKNRNIAFVGAIEKFRKAEDFLRVVNTYDPDGYFSSEWTDAVLGIRNTGGAVIYKNGCALEGLCVCSEDVHCAPGHGYLCRPGRVFTDARVCRKQVLD
ncbi:hypothetical protein KI387_035194 [Taxus chinensis]|uniref:L-gulonolactone oxidase n=1 Tax=Taxus chinensis TaxID=29808 RepID=A0AA38FQ17_TAXCH|nr:hypothetical protein KI387_035194 [Taxus chinensis]